MQTNPRALGNYEATVFSVKDAGHCHEEDSTKSPQVLGQMHRRFLKSSWVN